MNKNKKAQAFTLIELIVVIVVIGILTAITMSAYNGFVEKAAYAKAQAFEAQLRRKMLLSVENYVAFWNMAMVGEGGEILDGSGQGNNLYLDSSVIRTEGDAHSSHSDPFALSLDGSGTGITLIGQTLIPEDKITISIWFKLNRHKNYNQLYRYVDSRILIRVANNKKLCFNIGIPPQRTDTCYDEDIKLDTWYHVAGVYDGLKMQLYINGVVVDEADKVGYDLNPTNSTYMFLGRGDALPASVLDGYLDNVYVWGDAFKWDD